MQRRSESEWGCLIEEQSNSGKSQKKFCEERGISVASFQWRKMKLRRKTEPFVEIELPKESQESWKAELELPGGVKFRMNW